MYTAGLSEWRLARVIGVESRELRKAENIERSQKGFHEATREGSEHRAGMRSKTPVWTEHHCGNSDIEQGQETDRAKREGKRTVVI